MIPEPIDANAEAWRQRSPTLGRRVLCVGTEIALHGYRRPLELQELPWLHGAVTAVLGRGHARSSPRASLIPQQWSLLPWPSAPSGWAVVWWSEDDGLEVARSSRAARIGRVPVRVELGAAVRVLAPPAFTAGAYPVRLSTVTPVSVARTNRRGDGRRTAHEVASDDCLTSALWSLARKLRVYPSPPALRVVDHRTRPVSVRMRGKLGRVDGWSGSVTAVCSAPARWLLECASRGLALGARGAYGWGRVRVESCR